MIRRIVVLLLFAAALGFTASAAVLHGASAGAAHADCECGGCDECDGGAPAGNCKHDACIGQRVTAGAAVLAPASVPAALARRRARWIEPAERWPARAIAPKHRPPR